MPAGGNIPGGRAGGAGWADESGDFWLFGAYGYDAVGSYGNLNDLWVFQRTPGTLPAVTPVFSVAPETYSSAQSVKITDATPGTTIYYTLDGTTPTRGSTKYTTALSVAKTTTVKAIAEASGYGSSAVATATYTILKAQSITFKAPASPVTYGMKPIALSAKASSGLAVTFGIVSGPAEVSGSTLTITGAGPVVVAANQAGDSIYAAAPHATRTISVEKANLTVTANSLSMTKGAAVPALTYSMKGFVNADTQATATTGQPALSTTATSKSAVGTYPITVKIGTLAAANYSLALANGKLTVKR
jgi:hypothetical protein